MNKQELLALTLMLFNFRSENLEQQDLNENKIQDKVDTIFIQQGLNQDDSLSFNEFLKIFISNPDIIEYFKILGVLTSEDILFQNNTQQFYEDHDLIQEINKQKQLINEHHFDKKMGLDFLSIYPKNQKMEQANIKNQKVQPSEYQNIIQDKFIPNAQLKLEYVFGYRGYDCRNNIFYTKSGQMVYYVASYCIILDTIKNVQKIYQDHTNDVICLDVKEETGVSGQIGYNPLILVWSISNIQTLFIIKGDFEYGIANVCFSYQNKYIAANGIGDLHEIIIYDYEKCQADYENRASINIDQNRIAARSIGIKTQIYQLIFYDEEQLYAAGQNSLIHYKINHRQKKLFGKKLITELVQQPIMSLQRFNDFIVTGIYDGTLSVWRDNRNISNVIKAHQKQVNALCISNDKNRLFSGGADGMIYVWVYEEDQDCIKQILKYDIQTVDCIFKENIKIVALQELNNSTMLIGTRNCEIIEFKQNRFKIVQEAHFNQKLKGLSISKNSNNFYTCGDDGMIGYWCILQNKLLKKIQTEYSLKCCNESPKGDSLAVGCQDGTILIINTESFEIMFTITNKKEVTCVKYSNEGDWLFASINPPFNVIQIYDVEQNYTYKGSFRGSTSQIISFDISEDGQILQAQNKNKEILYFDFQNQKENLKGQTDYKEEKWKSWSLSYGWPMIGCWQGYRDGDEITKVDRSPDNKFICIGDKFGQLKLYNYPANQNNVGFQNYVSHCCEISNLQFHPNMPCLLTIGAENKSIIKWSIQAEDERVQFEDEEYEVQIKPSKFDFYQEKEKLIEQQLQNNLKHKNPFDQVNSLKIIESHEQNTLSNGELQLQYIYGMTGGEKHKNNVKYNQDGQLIYFSQATAIKLNCLNNTQQFFQKHQNTIICIDSCPQNRNIIATGQIAENDFKNSQVLIWNSQNLEQIIKLKKFNKNSVYILKFNPNSQRLLAIGYDQYHSVGIYDWKNNILISTALVDQNQVTDVTWQNDNSFITVGLSHIKYWSIDGKYITQKWGQYNEQIPPINCIAFYKEKCFTGNKFGEICLWEYATLKKKQSSHQGPVNCLMATDALYSAGTDAKIFKWDVNKNFIHIIQVIFDISNYDSQISGIFGMDMLNDSLIVAATQGGELIEFRDGNYKTLVHSHYDGEIVSCSISAENYEIITLQTGGILMKWDAKTNELLKIQKLNCNFVAMDWTKEGNIIIFGDEIGVLKLYDAISFKQLDQLKTCFIDKEIESQGINLIKFDFSGTKAVVTGKLNNDIFVISIQKKQLKELGIFRTNLLIPIQNIDWSQNSCFIMVNTLDNQLLYYDIQAFIQILQKDQIINTNWSSNKCIISPYTQGVFDEDQFVNINVVERAKNKIFICAGSQDGQLTLMNYPAQELKQKKKYYYGQSSPITNILFSFDDTFLYSICGIGRSIFQYKVIFQNNKTNIIKSKQGIIQKPKLIKGIDKFLSFDQKSDKQFLSQINNNDQQWKNKITPPSQKVNNNDNHKKPDCQLSIEYIYGFRTKDQRNNVFYTANDDIVFNATCFGVVMNIHDNSQKYFKQHRQEISAIAIQNNKIKIATGELGAKPSIYIWNTKTLMLDQSYTNILSKGICALTFSNNSRYLAAAAIDDDNSIALIDLLNQKMTPRIFKSGNQQIIDFHFVLDNQLACATYDNINIWQIDNFSVESISYPKAIFTCCIAIKDIIVASNNKGEILLIHKNTIYQTIKLSVEAVNCLYQTEKYLFAGGREGILFVIDKNDVQSHSQVKFIKFNLHKIMEKQQIICKEIISIVMHSNNRKIIIGTYGADIIELEFQDSQISKLTGLQFTKTITTGHYCPLENDDTQLWGLIPFNQKNYIFGTASFDGTFKIFDSILKKQVFVYKFYDKMQNINIQYLEKRFQGRCLAINQDDSQIIVGFRDGQVNIYSLNEEMNQMNIIASNKDSNDCISDIKFSQNYTQLAVASFDNIVYLYKIINDQNKIILQLQNKLKHQSPVIHIDYSFNSLFLMTNILNYDILYWDCITGKLISDGSQVLNDVKWQTWNSIYGWPVQGIWKSNDQGSFINCVDRSNLKHPNGYYLLACGDDFYNLQVFRFPNLKQDSQSEQGKGHSSFISNVKWSKDDKYIYSLGGQDNFVIQWNIYNY